MSFGAGLLTGIAGGMTDARDRKERERQLSVMEAMAANRPAPGSGMSAPAGSPGAGMAPYAPYDGKVSDRANHAFEFFRAKGVPDHVAAGLVGNLMQESGVDINPAAVGDNGNAYGAGQWNGPRKASYMAFARARGAQPMDFDTQLEYLWHEGQTSEKGAWDRIMGASTPEEAAVIASDAFWRPGAPHNDRRAGYATSVYGNRKANPNAAPAASAAPATPKASEWFTGFFAK